MVKNSDYIFSLVDTKYQGMSSTRTERHRSKPSQINS